MRTKRSWIRCTRSRTKRCSIMTWFMRTTVINIQRQSFALYNYIMHSHFLPSESNDKSISNDIWWNNDETNLAVVVSLSFEAVTKDGFIFTVSNIGWNNTITCKIYTTYFTFVQLQCYVQLRRFDSGALYTVNICILQPHSYSIFATLPTQFYA